MNLPSNKGDPTIVAYPRTLSTIAASVCGLAIFIVLTSLLLVSQPIYPTIRLYLDGIDHSSKFDSLSWENRTINDSHNDGNEELRKFDSQHDGNGIDDSYVKSDASKSGGSQSVTVAHPDGSGGVMDKNQSSNSDDISDSSNFQQREETTSDASPVVVSETKASVDQQGKKDAGNSSFFNVTTNTENVRIPSPGLLNNSNAKQPGLDVSSLSPAPISQTGSVDTGTTKYSLSFKSS